MRAQKIKTLAMKTKQKIVVIGAGFAGLSFAKSIDGKLFEVILIDKLNHHQFQPLFYQVAAAQLEPSSISFPIRNIFRNQSHITVKMCEVLEIKTHTQQIITTQGSLPYDKLVIATGCKTNFFQNSLIEKHAFTLKSTTEAIQVRNHLLGLFESLSSEDHTSHDPRNTIVIVGGGPTGVELAGAFSEIIKRVLPQEYPSLDPSKMKVILIEGSKHTLNNMSDLAKIASQQYLESMSVEVITETFVKNYDGSVITLNNGQTIQSSTLIWAAGVSGNILPGLNESCYLPNARYKVNRFNQITGYTNIYAIGDIASMETPKYPKGHPQVANVAINQAKNLAKNLKRDFQGGQMIPYEYTDLGSMATIGKNKAVVDLPFVKFKGFFAWLVWMFLHLMLILSVRNKLIILIHWTWAYFTRDSSLRLIFKPNKTTP
jgi:NADH:ubiquinone reductase (H+-translocating)